MPDIPISREQEAYIDALRNELDDEMAYGHVRVQDAVQYLIDHHREDGDLDVEIDPGTPEESAGDAPDTAGEGDSEGSEPTDGDQTEGDVPDAEQDGSANGQGNGDGSSPADAEGGGVDDAVAALGNAGPGGGGGGSDSGGTDGESKSPDGETTTSSGSGTIGGADSERVEEMMNLMDAHDDVWEETDAADGKYSVDLPDGGRETVATKDDVRALLFKHYQ